MDKVTVHSAQRTILANSKIEKAIGAATILRRELDKVTGWRAKAISDLICDKDGALRKIDSPNDMFRVVDAVGLRDDHFNNSYFKILLRRLQLVALLLILFLTVVFCLFMWKGRSREFRSSQAKRNRVRSVRMPRLLAKQKARGRVLEYSELSIRADARSR
jgi:hypothetical protein